MSLTDKPLAAPGLTSYRYRGRCGWIMIGATDHADALVQAARSTTEPVDQGKLQIWSAQGYVDVIFQELAPSPAKPAASVYMGVFGSLQHWYCEVRTANHQRVFLGPVRQSSYLAAQDATQFAREQGYQLCANPRLEDAAFEAYDFGPSVTVEGVSGWVRDGGSSEMSCKVFVRLDEDPPDAASHVVMFTVVLNGGVIEAAWATLNGNQIGHLPQLAERPSSQAAAPRAMRERA